MSYITNTAAVNFHSAGNTGTSGGVTISHASLILRYGESNEILIWTGALVNSRVLSAGDPMTLPAGALDINFPNGVVNDAAIKAALDALYTGRSSSATCLLGTGTMGAGGKTREVADSNYERKTVALTIAVGTAPS